MKATVINVGGSVNNPKVLSGGLLIKNPTLTPITSATLGSDRLALISRTLDAQAGDETILVKAYGGNLTKSNGTEFNVVKTEVADGVTVKTYSLTFDRDSYNYTFSVDGVQHTIIGRRLFCTVASPRIDVLGDVDLMMDGSSSEGYLNPLTIHAEQIKYSGIPKNCIVFNNTSCIGEMETSWFRENTTASLITITGWKTSIKGSLMDFVNCGRSLSRINLYYQTGVTGDIREYLNALKNAGVRNKTIEIRISTTSITNDVTPSYSPVFATFDSSGDWTASNS